jgi:hypothetical protein
VTYFRRIDRNVFNLDESSGVFSEALEAGDAVGGVVVSLMVTGVITASKPA